MPCTGRGLYALLVVVAWACPAGCAPAERAHVSPPPVAQSIREIEQALDVWHAAASVSDEERYFDAFAPDAVFLGTDPGERWTVAEFRAYAHPHFAAGRGWTYAPSERHVVVAEDGTLAWFDEQLDNAKYGQLRGTGVLRKLDGGSWKLVHYSMSFPVPNAATPAVVEVLRARPTAGQEASE